MTIKNEWLNNIKSNRDEKVFWKRIQSGFLQELETESK